MNNEQAIVEVLSEYVEENANLKIIIKNLQMEIEALKKESKEEDE